MKRTKWWRLDRMVPLMTLLGAGLVGGLSLTDWAKADAVHSATMAVLVLLAGDALVTRLGVLERIESKLGALMPAGQVSLRSRAAMIGIPEQLGTAKEVTLCAIHGTSALLPFVGLYRERLAAGMKLRVVLTDPDLAENVELDAVGERSLGTARAQILMSLRMLAELSAEHPGQLEVRLLRRHLPFSIFGADIEQKSGAMTVEFQSFGEAIDQRPHVRLQRAEQTFWYEHYARQVERILATAETISPAALQQRFMG